MKSIFAIITLLALLGCSPSTPGNPSTQSDPSTPINPPKEYTLDEDIGQLLLVGFRGQSLDSTHHLVRDLRDYHVGAVILFDYDASTGQRGRNIKDAEQLRTLCAQLRSYNPALLIGIDQEGGYVSRLSPRYGFPRIPTAKRLGTLGDDSIRHYAALTATMLTDLGINLNFAPVADVDINPRCPVIGGIERSFSAQPATVSHCCRLWVEEQYKRQVISCMKHFPGHGSATGDTHKGLVDVTDTWQRSELEPYRQLPQGTLVMTAHVVNRQLDPSGLPASLSPLITAYLRDSLGFNGVIVTDDLAMGAVAGRYGFDQIIRLALLAGADMLCLSNNGGTYDPDLVPRAVKAIKQLIADGELPEERIRQSANRIRNLVP